MKKTGAIILTVFLTAAITVGAVFGIQRAVARHNGDSVGTVQKITAEIDYLDDTYISGDLIVFRVLAYSDEQMTSVKYAIDNGAEVAVTAITGTADNGGYYIDTGAETVASEGLAEGEHLIKFYVYIDTTRYQVQTTQLFTVKSDNK